jgi:hypothetical protein
LVSTYSSQELLAPLEEKLGANLTTIAFDGKTLAADSLVLSGNLKFGYQDKIYKLKDGRYLATAGDICVIPSVIAWLNGGEKPILPVESNFIAILLGKKGQFFEIDKDLLIYPACIPWVGGSGDTIALTAMHCGKTAFEAVEIACKLDHCSGGEIKQIQI